MTVTFDTMTCSLNENSQSLRVSQCGSVKLQLDVCLVLCLSSMRASSCIKQQCTPADSGCNAVRCWRQCGYTAGTNATLIVRISHRCVRPWWNVVFYWMLEGWLHHKVCLLYNWWHCWVAIVVQNLLHTLLCCCFHSNLFLKQSEYLFHFWFLTFPIYE